MTLGRLNIIEQRLRKEGVLQQVYGTSPNLQAEYEL